ncbi:type 1 periplasmic-binding domain-containing protein [Flindersiella endophytica]
MNTARLALTGLAAGLLLIGSACRSSSDTATPEASNTTSGIRTDRGVTSEPCPARVNPKNGCIYLGVISDLTVGPFAANAVPLTAAQEAFWKRVNERGGIGGYDVDIKKYTRDSQYNPEIHNRMYQEIRGNVLGLAQTLGSSQTAAIIGDMRKDNVIGMPASWNSNWNFDDIIFESGANYCFESMNGVDWATSAAAKRGQIRSVMAVHFPNDYGADASAGVRTAATAHGLRFSATETPPGPDNQGAAIAAIVQQKPDLVYVTTGPSELAALVGQTAARGYKGTFVGSSPTWNPALLKTAAAPALQAMYFQAAPWGAWNASTPGHQAMRDAVGDVTPSPGYIAGWVWSYPMLAALEAAAKSGDLTRAGVHKAAASLKSVDYEGMLPSSAGNYAGMPGSAFRQTMINAIDPKSTDGVKTVADFFTGPTAKAYDFSKPCVGG